MFPEQEALRYTSFAPTPEPLPYVVAPGDHPGGTIPIILSNANGMQVHILAIGATIQRLIVPNQQGMAEDVVLGFDDPNQYQVKTWQSCLTILALLYPRRSVTVLKGSAVNQ